MALVDLQSNLSWYSTNGRPVGYRPNTSVNDTRFTGNEDSTFTSTPRGFDNNGFRSTFSPLTSANEFYIDNTSTSFRGTATRLSQQGEGSKFPLGPLGQVHDFDTPRLGFNFKNKYGEIYNSLSNSGLADTYTQNSPIDDMYNKFKVREEAWNPDGAPEQPYILRGIQRDDSSDPERFGRGIQGSRIDLPRGGLVTAVQRAKIDLDRLTKFLKSTKGNQWFVKQQLLHIMQPNRESSTGDPQVAIHANSSKVFQVNNFLKTLANQAFSLGNQIRRHGQSDIDTPGYLPFPPSPPSNYEDIIKERNRGQLQDGTTVDPTNDNRLVKVYRELLRTTDGWKDGAGIGSSIPQLTAPFGPTSIGFGEEGFDIQGSAIRRWAITKPDNNSEISIGDEFGVATKTKYSDLVSKFVKWDFTSRYTDTVFYNSDTEFESPLSKLITDDYRTFKTNMTNVILPGGRFTSRVFDTNAKTRLNISYDDIQKGNDLRKDAGAGRDKLIDFRSSKLAKANPGVFDIDPYQPYTLIDPQGYRHVGGVVDYQENMLRNLRLDVQEGASAPDGTTGQFNGRGVSNRAINDGPNKGDKIQSRDPLTGRWKNGEQREDDSNSRTTETEYRAFGQAATDRVDAKNTNLDFRNNEVDPTKDPVKYQTYIGTDPEGDVQEELAVKRIAGDDFDGIQNPFDKDKRPGPRNPATNISSNAAGFMALQTYKTMAYGDIRTAAKERTFKSAPIKSDGTTDFAILDFRNEGKEISADDSAANALVNSGQLLTLKFNDIEFSAYIDSISDSFSPSYTAEADQNRADPRYLYTSFERKVTISFKVVYEFSDKPPYDDLKALADFTTPGYGGGPWGQGVFVTLGTLYNDVPMLIESLTYDWDNETPWAMAGDQADNYDGLPMYTQVQVSLIYLGDVKPAKGNGYVLYGS